MWRTAVSISGKIHFSAVPKSWCQVLGALTEVRRLQVRNAWAPISFEKLQLLSHSSFKEETQVKEPHSWKKRSEYMDHICLTFNFSLMEDKQEVSFWNYRALTEESSVVLQNGVGLGQLPQNWPVRQAFRWGFHLGSTSNVTKILLFYRNAVIGSTKGNKT